MCNANENDPLKNVFNIVGIRYALVPVFDPTRDTGGGARARAPETDPRARLSGQRERGAALISIWTISTSSPQSRNSPRKVPETRRRVFGIRDAHDDASSAPTAPTTMLLRCSRRRVIRCAPGGASFTALRSRRFVHERFTGSLLT